MSENEEERIFFKAVEVMENSRDDEWMKAIYAAIRETARTCARTFVVSEVCPTAVDMVLWYAKAMNRLRSEVFPKAFEE